MGARFWEGQPGGPGRVSCGARTCSPQKRQPHLQNQGLSSEGAAVQVEADGTGARAAELGEDTRSKKGSFKRDLVFS